MSLQDIELTNSKILKLAITEIESSCVVVIYNGRVEIRELPSFGEYMDSY